VVGVNPVRVWGPPITGPTRENILGHQRLIGRPALEDGAKEVNALKLTLRTRGAGSNVANVQRQTFALSELITIATEPTLCPRSDAIGLGNQIADCECHAGTPLVYPSRLSSIQRMRL
jgi:hypothetical protein